VPTQYNLNPGSCSTAGMGALIRVQGTR